MNNCIYEIRKEALALKDRSPLAEVQKLFFPGNPWLVDYVESIDESERQEAIEELADELPKGYSVNGDTISITQESKDYSGQFKQEILSNLNDEGCEILRKGSPFLWFKQVLFGTGSILIYFENEIHTFKEFLLLLAGHSYNMDKLYIGAIYEYHY